MPDSTTPCALCLVERGVQTPAQIDWPGIPICRECAAVTAARVSGEPASGVSLPTVSAPEMLQ
jgi:hypothetical protein